MNAWPVLRSKTAALATEFARRAAEHDEAASFPFENIGRLREAGLLSLVVPAAFGGGGGDLRAANLVVNAIGAGEPSTALVLAQQYLFHFRMLRHPAFPPALAGEIARSAVTGGALCNALLVEPEQGSPICGGLPATAARRVQGGFRLTGRKIYSTGSIALRWLAVWARTDDAAPFVGGFIIDAAVEKALEVSGNPGLSRHNDLQRHYRDVLCARVHSPQDDAIRLNGGREALSIRP